MYAFRFAFSVQFELPVELVLLGAHYLNYNCDQQMCIVYGIICGLWSQGWKDRFTMSWRFWFSQVF